MARYTILNGDRIVGFVEWDGLGKHPYGDMRLEKVSEYMTAEWIGKSYAEAGKAANAAKDGDKVISPAKDAKEGKRPEDLVHPGGLAPSGEAINNTMGDAAMAQEFPLDPVLGSEVRPPPDTVEHAAKKLVEEVLDKRDAEQRLGSKTPAGRDTFGILGHDPSPAKGPKPAATAAKLGFPRSAKELLAADVDGMDHLAFIAEARRILGKDFPKREDKAEIVKALKAKRDA